jgi:hypothetical protein
MGRVLVACEYSGITREAFRKAGHDAWSCDLLPTEIPGQHYQGDVRDVLGWNWDLIVAHPDCTYITNSGVRWLDNPKPGQKVRPGILTGPARWRAMWDACEFFRLFVDSKCDRVAIENPVPHKYALRWIGRKYNQTIQPWQFGCGETKRTCLWLKGLPKLQATEIVAGREARVHRMSPGDDRGHERSRSYPGIAAAMAAQWGKVIV